MANPPDQKDNEKNKSQKTKLFIIDYPNVIGINVPKTEEERKRLQHVSDEFKRVAAEIGCIVSLPDDIQRAVNENFWNLLQK